MPDRVEREVAITTEGVSLDGFLKVPTAASGLVLFAHGSGSSRHSPRNRYVAEVLDAAGLATLLFDLLTSEEGERDAIDRRLRFDIELLARRVIGALDWSAALDEARGLPLGIFGASTGAAAALIAAAARPERVAAVVSRGGRPDLAGASLASVRAPTLLIVGGLDHTVIGLNEAAKRQLGAPVELSIIAGATHLFDEPGTLEQVATRAAAFFRDQFARADLRSVDRA